jgi:hypothetical protein
MNRYVDFLQREPLPFPACFTKYYGEFSRRFLGSPHDLRTDLRQTFDEAFFSVSGASLVLCPTLLTEGYDDNAVDYFRACHFQQGGPPSRLIYYRLYLCPDMDRHFIEFWDIPRPFQFRNRTPLTLPKASESVSLCSRQPNTPKSNSGSEAFRRHLLRHLTPRSSWWRNSLL